MTGQPQADDFGQMIIDQRVKTADARRECNAIRKLHLDRRASALAKSIAEAVAAGRMPLFAGTQFWADTLGVSPQLFEILRCGRDGPPFLRIGTSSRGSGRVLYSAAEMALWLSERAAKWTRDHQVPPVPGRRGRGRPRKNTTASEPQR